PIGPLGCSLAAVLSLALFSCGESDDATGAQALQPEDASDVEVDRFAAGVGMLQQRSATNGLPAAGEPVDFDRGPFITHGLGPNGEKVAYYNFDVQSTTPAPIYVLFREGATAPVPGQLNVIDVVPGDAGYNDFWQIQRVRVPASYVANAVTSLEQIEAAGYAVEATEQLVNCPVVPRGSIARQRLAGADPGLSRGWYRGQVAYYFNFEERSLSGAAVPRADIFVTFNINPGTEGGGPPSGFKTETGSEQTHNVLTALPDSADYSPLWAVAPYDNMDFERVDSVASIQPASVLARGVANVNCPVVEVQD
ncbi:MAG: hypothetical protein RL033_8064, partial [Pseudomonadota bacterium]